MAGALAQLGHGPLGVVAPLEVEIQCDAFSGSLGLLLEAVRRQKVDLLGVPITPVCEAYFLHLVDRAEFDFESAVAALVALAYLLERKAWALLPRSEPEPEAPEPSANFLVSEMDDWRSALEALRLLHEERQTWFFRRARPDRPYDSPVELGEHALDELARAFARAVERATTPEVPILVRPRRSLSEQLVLVRASLDREWRTMEELIAGPYSREDAVWWFLALLELVRVGAARVRIESEVKFRLA